MIAALTIFRNPLVLYGAIALVAFAAFKIYVAAEVKAAKLAQQKVFEISSLEAERDARAKTAEERRRIIAIREKRITTLAQANNALNDQLGNAEEQYESDIEGIKNYAEKTRDETLAACVVGSLADRLRVK